MISDNNHISYSAEDIQRYWNGQLSPQEMHAMEKAALDDPFLADAIEGMGLALQEHDEETVNAPLVEMRRQLQVRTGPQTRAARVIRFRWWQAAAAALVLLTVGYWIFSTNEVQNKDTLAASRQQSPVPAETRATADSVNTPAPRDTQAAATDDGPALVSAPKTTTRSKEPGLFDFKTNNAQGKKDSVYKSSLANNEARRLQLPPASIPDLKKKNQDSSNGRANTQPAVQFDSSFKGETEVVKIDRDFYANADKLLERKEKPDQKLQNVVKGIVTDTRNNPLPNVFIRLDGRTNAFNTDISNTYTTDRSGNFNIPISDSVVNVSVSLPGYGTQNFRLRSTHDGAGMADNQLKLEPASEQAQRLVNQGYQSNYDKKSSPKQKDMAGPFPKINQQDAQPMYGWITYEQYLERNKQIPASNPNLIGEVAVSFELNKKGETRDFKVEKSLSPDHDAEAIRLIRMGPGWELKKGRKTRVTVIVRF